MSSPTTTTANWDLINLTTSGDLKGENLKTAYDDWSQKYNQDYDKAAYNGPAIAAVKMMQIMKDKDCRILDVGCGTGLVGEQLSKRGFTNIHGIDFSEKCLEMAKETGAYRSLCDADVMVKGIPNEDNYYDALVTVGTFVPGHLGPSSFNEFCRVVKPGGYILVAMREAYIFDSPDFNNNQLDSVLTKLSEAGIWTYRSREWVPNYIDDMPGVVFTFQLK